MDKYTKIKHRVEQNRDEENAVKMSKYMRDLFKFYGLATPIRKSFYKDYTIGKPYFQGRITCLTK